MENGFSVKLAFAILLLLLAAFVGAIQATDEIQSARPVGGDTNKLPANLEFQLPFKAGSDESAQFKAAVSGFAVGGAKLLPRSKKTRFMVGVRFTSRSVRSARMEITLLQNFQDPRPLHRFSHVEELGPERVTKRGPTLDIVRNWDDERALWFDLPVEARAAEAFRVEVHLQYQNEEKGP